MKKILVNEVGPRDGLQNIENILNVEERFDLIKSLEKAGINSLEVGSFVNPKSVPAMANTDVLLDKLSTSKSHYSVLIPNTFGYKAAKENRVGEICLVLCATESMNMENINKNIKDTIAEFKEIIQMTKSKSFSNLFSNKSGMSAKINLFLLFLFFLMKASLEF